MYCTPPYVAIKRDCIEGMNHGLVLGDHQPGGPSICRYTCVYVCHAGARTHQPAAPPCGRPPAARSAFGVLLLPLPGNPNPTPPAQTARAAQLRFLPTPTTSAAGCPLRRPPHVMAWGPELVAAARGRRGLALAWNARLQDTATHRAARHGEEPDPVLQSRQAHPHATASTPRCIGGVSPVRFQYISSCRKVAVRDLRPCGA